MGQQATKPLSVLTGPLRRRGSSVDAGGTCVVVGLYKACPWPDAAARKLVERGEIAPRSFGSDTPDDDTCQEECPICFRHYPRMNISLCCRQIVCSECYLQVSSPTVEKSCPFCATAVLKVNIYKEIIVSPTAANNRDMPTGIVPLFSASDENRVPPRTPVQSRTERATTIPTTPPKNPAARPMNHTPTKTPKQRKRRNSTNTINVSSINIDNNYKSVNYKNKTNNNNINNNNNNNNFNNNRKHSNNSYYNCEEEEKEGVGSGMTIQFATTAQKNQVLREAQRQAKIVGYDNQVSSSDDSGSTHQSPHKSAAAMADMEERLLSEAINASLVL